SNHINEHGGTAAVVLIFQNPPGQAPLRRSDPAAMSNESKEKRSIEKLGSCSVGGMAAAEYAATKALAAAGISAADGGAAGAGDSRNQQSGQRCPHCDPRPQMSGIPRNGEMAAHQVNGMTTRPWWA